MTDQIKPTHPPHYDDYDTDEIVKPHEIALIIDIRGEEKPRLMLPDKSMFSSGDIVPEIALVLAAVFTRIQEDEEFFQEQVKWFQEQSE